MTYTTTPGTAPHRAVEYLKSKPRGTEVNTLEFADLINADTQSFVSIMGNAVKAGLLKSRIVTGSRRMTYWSLGDGVPLDQPTDPDEVDDWPIRRPRNSSSSIFPFAPARPDCRINEFEDGSMVIENHGGKVNLAPEHAQQLREFVAKRGCVA